jgi:hypothetical protein
MTDNKMKRRWFRFSLWTLFVLVTVVAVGSVAYWIGWPSWQDYCERTSVEKLFMTFKRGMTTDECENVFFDDYSTFKGQVQFESSSSVRAGTGNINLDAGKATYVAFIEFEPNGSDGTVNTCKRIEVYQLPQPQVGYKARTEIGRDLESRYFATRPFGPYEFARLLYIKDFNQFITGDRKNNPGFQYELIYSDPPK